MREHGGNGEWGSDRHRTRRVTVGVYIEDPRTITTVRGKNTTTNQDQQRNSRGACASLTYSGSEVTPEDDRRVGCWFRGFQGVPWGTCAASVFGECWVPS